MEATTKDLRLHTKSLMAATSRGEEVIISYRGKKRAKLVPLDNTLPTRRGANPLFGLWANLEEPTSVDDLVRQLRQPRSFDDVD
ncbi:type II toxin-antitoxin system Phd/YefM family antitoxin [Marinimicrobium agarilyticum]|uniref:type II toxin-antitoxin system Phd/YefM family antitoxin n=1 Tax=Marinimicrobium agarilyticum TaxID=306546 RepID=UPI000A03592D|nr:prevent-host-death family protein [Marinimicrobium agarilyticum]